MIGPNRPLAVILLVAVDTDGLLEILRKVVEPARVDH